MAARIIGVMGLISAGFLLFIMITSNPFLRLDPIPVDGNDLNPLLQDPAMAIHPPMLYTGYVGFSVAFAFAIAATAGRQGGPRMGALGTAVDDGGLDLSDHRHMPRQLVGLLRAGLGRLVVLGPGGERLLHAVAGRHRADSFAGRDGETRPVQELRPVAGHSAFSLSLLGTFLVRSGVSSRCMHSPAIRHAACLSWCFSPSSSAVR